MIGRISGTLIHRTARAVIVDCGGVGYRVFTSDFTLRQLGPSESLVTLFTHLHAREDALELYGFQTLSELEFFEGLISVSGVGPRTALAIMGVAPVDQLKRAIAAGDLKHLTKVAGIGKKTAEKVVLELRDKFSGGAEIVSHSVDGDALDALVQLGYSVMEARDLLREIPAEGADTKARVQQVLRRLGKSHP